MTSVLATSGATAFWYLTRGSGIVTLLLLTVAVVMGIVTSVRWESLGWPRFILEWLHRNSSLLVVVFLAIHIATSVADSFAPIRWLDAIVPFTSSYRPLWLGLGALATDLLLALIITSLIRVRLGYWSWRAIHWLAYACWPVALLHGLGTGSDVKQSWMLILNAVCIAAVAMAAMWRLTTGWPRQALGRAFGLLASIAVPLGVALWVLAGPLQPGWARTAGTPSALLKSNNANVATAAPTTPAPSSSTTTPAATQPASSLIPQTGFSAPFQGTIRQSNPDSNGITHIDIRGPLGGSQVSLDIVLDGQAIAGGGVNLTQGQVLLGTAAQPALYSGPVSQLESGNVRAVVQDSSGHRLVLTVALVVDSQSGTASGQVNALPPRAGGDASGTERG